MFKVKLKFSDGDMEELDGIFDTESEAEEYALESISEYNLGGEILNMSNPGDYPLEEEIDVDFEIIEID